MPVIVQGLRVVREIAVGQHGPLGHPGGAAGVLQEGQVVVAEDHRFGRLPASLGKGGGEVDGPGERPGRHQLLGMAHHPVDQHPLRKSEHFPHGRHDHVTDGRVADDLLQGMGEVFDDDDGRGARILQLVLQLPRGVEGVAVDHHTARPQGAEQGHRILEQIGHHQRHPIPLAQASGLQPAGELPRAGIQVRVAQLPPHADERRLTGITTAGLIHQGNQGRTVVDGDVGGHPRRVAVEPDLVHAPLLVLFDQMGR